jgi:hypothetical protein
MASCMISGFGKQSKPLEDDHLLQLCWGPAGGRARVPGAVGLPLPVPVAPCRRLSSLWHHPGEDHSYRDSIMRVCWGPAGGRARVPGAVGLPLPVPMAPCRRLSSLGITQVRTTVTGTVSNSFCLLNQNTAYILATTQFSSFFLFMSVGTNC